MTYWHMPDIMKTSRAHKIEEGPVVQSHTLYYSTKFRYDSLCLITLPVRNNKLADCIRYY